MEFSCSDRKWLLPDEMDAPDVDRNFALGLHVPGTFYKVIDTRACLLQPQLGNRILDDVRKFIRSSGVPVYGLRSHVGFWRFVMLRHSKAYDRWMVNIITAKENRKTVQFLADQLANTYPQIVSVVNNITSRKAGIAVGEYEILLSGSAGIRDKIGEFEFEISANSFFQTNTLAARRLYETVKEYADLSGKETVVDLYSGTGAIALFISGSARTVIGMEIAESAVNDAVRNCRINGISNCRFILGDIKHGIAELTAVPDVMIIDPPRAGMHKDVVRRILELAPARIIYVSCNPSTMARDLGLLKERYRVLDVQPVDMFPHTYHIESVAKLAKKGLRPLEVGGSLSAVVASLPRRSGYEGRKGYYFSRRSQGYFGEVCGEVGSLEVGGKRSEVRSRRTEISKEKIEKRKEAGATRLEVRGWRQDEGQMTESRGRRRDEIRGMMEEGRGAEVRNQISDVGSRED
jgi:23S rRNA (uracil1939-C5)-methyltransferase